MKAKMTGLVALVFTLAASGQTAQPTPPPASLEPVGNGGGYAVNLSRPWVGGNSYTLSLDLAVNATGGSGQDVEFWSPKNKDQRITFLGKVRVIDVNAAGEGTTLVVRVEKASTTENGKTRTLKLEGSDLGVAFPFGQSHFVQRDGKPIPPEDVAVLKQIFPPPTNVSEADYMSPGRPVKPGDRWSMNRETLAKALAPPSASGAAAALEVTEGSVAFESIESLEGVEFLHLVATWSFKTGDSERFTGTNITQIREDLFLPRDPAIRTTRRTTALTGQVNGRVRNSENQLIQVKGITKITRKVEIRQG